MKFLKILGFVVILGMFQSAINAPNPGNVTKGTNCFLDSTIQMLFCSEPFMKFLEKYGSIYPKDSSAGLIFEHINALKKATDPIDSDTFREKLAVSKVRYIASGQIKSSKKFNDYAGAQEHDAGEFLDKVIDAFSEEATVINHEHKTLQIPALGTIISVNSLPETKIANSLQIILTESKLALKLAPVVVFSLPRFVLFGAGKNIRASTFPLQNLELAGVKYYLYGIVCHSGNAITGAEGGHYWGYAKYFGNNTWYYYNNAPYMYTHGYTAQDKIGLAKKQVDNDAEKASQLPVLSMEDKDIKAIADQQVERGLPYLLFYQRSDWKPEEPKTEDKTGGLSDRLDNLKKKLLELAAVLGTITKKS